MKQVESLHSPAFNLRILIVEDDDGLRNLISKTLRKAGYETESFPSGTRAVERYIVDPACILLLDQCLPDMTGKSLVETLRERGLDPFFIIITGQGDERLAVEMMKLGAYDYLVKDSELYERLPLACAALLRQMETHTRLQATEKALSATEQRYQSITEQLTEMLFIHDLKGSILEVNRAAVVGTGYTRQELLGMSIFLLHAAHEGEPGSEIIRGKWLNWPVGNRVSLESSYRCKDGSSVPMEIHTGKVILDGHEVLIVLATDITARKTAEEKIIRQIEELKRWHKITMEREDRILQLKNEVNHLLRDSGKPPRYASALERKHE